MSNYTTEVRWICESIYDNGTIPTETKSYTPTYERGGIDEHGLDVDNSTLVRTNYIKFYDSVNNILTVTFPDTATVYYYEYSLQGSYNFLSGSRLTSEAGLFINNKNYYRFVVSTDIVGDLENITYTYKIAEERTPNNIVKEVHNRIFNFPYDFYSNVTEDIEKFEKQFLLYYYTREICEETVGLWKLRLQNELNLIMPKYKELYKTLQLEYNPLFDVEYWRENDTDKNGVSGYRTNYVYTPRVETTNTNERKIEENESRTEQNKNKIDESKISNEGITRANERDVNKAGVSERTDNGTRFDNDGSTDWDLYSDTPQGGITGIEHATDGQTVTETGALVANAYLTDARKKTHTGNADSTTNATSKNTENNISNESENENTNRNTSGSSLQNIEGENTGSTVRSNTDDTTNVTSTLGENTTDTTHHAESSDLRNEKEHIYGKTSNVTYQKLIKEYRDNIINLNKMLIEELSSLFFGLW